MTGHRIRVLSADEAQARRAALVDLLLDAIASGASVNFIEPMKRANAEAWWDTVLAGHARGERAILTAEADGRIDGTVQLVPAAQENEAFRADVAKLLVHERGVATSAPAGLAHPARQSSAAPRSAHHADRDRQGRRELGQDPIGGHDRQPEALRQRDAGTIAQRQAVGATRGLEMARRPGEVRVEIDKLHRERLHGAQGALGVTPRVGAPRRSPPPS